MKVNLAVDLDAEGFSGSVITDYASGSTNCIVYKAGEKVKVSQRPSIDISESASGIAALNNRARGLFYWEASAKLYIVHDNDLYSQTQSSARIAEVTGTFSAGTERCTFIETVGTQRLVILDAENNKGWYLTVGESLNQIASNFPATLVHGGAILDGFLFVMNDDGAIYNSAFNDPTVFPTTGFLTAERDNDKGVYLGKHHEHIVAFSTRTIEFFYNANNVTGSPLNRRQDLVYSTGCVSGTAVWEDGDVTFFLGSNPTGQVACYKLENFQISPVSNEPLNSFFTQAITQDSIRFALSGFSQMGHRTLIVTSYTLTGAAPGQIMPQQSLSYDSVTGFWGFIKTSLNAHTTFPVISFTKRTGGQNAVVAARTGEGIFHNGDIFNTNDRLLPIDTLLASAGVYEDGVYEVDVYEGSASGVGSNIAIIVRTGLIDGDTEATKFQATKFQASETISMESTALSQTMRIRHSNGVSNNFNVGNTVDTSLTRKKISQGGSFIRRNYQLEYSGSEQIYMRDLDIDVGAGL